jgi:hypothetical protein
MAFLSHQSEGLPGALRTAIVLENMDTLREIVAAGKTDFDAHGGAALRLCATHDNYLAAKTLLLAGADISHAILQAEKEERAIPRRHEWHEYATSPHVVFNSRDDESRSNCCKYEIEKLKKFKGMFLETVLPQAQFLKIDAILKHQEELAAQIATLQEAVREITHPRPLEKPRYTTPAAVRGKTP